MAPASRPSPLSPLLAFLLVVVLLGLAAAVLLAPAPAGQGISLAPSLHAPAAPTWIGLAAVFALVAGPFFIGGISRGRPTWIVGLILVCLAVGTVLAVIFRFIHPSSSGATTNGTVTAPPSCQTNPAYCNYTFPTGPSAPTIAPWYDGAVLYGLLLAVVVVAALLIPRVLAIRTRRTGVGGAPGPDGAREELRRALDRLSESGPGDDDRRRIIRAYGELLRTVGDRLPDLETATPREIAREVEAKFGIRPATAEELTGLFEEARYSRDRPMGAGAVDRAEAALRRALEESTARRDASP